MKKIFVLVIGLSLMLCKIVFADVAAEVISYKIDDNGNIEVHTQYKVDGVEVQSRYPQENGKYYWVTRYVASAFGDMTDAQIKSRILREIEDYATALIADSFIKKANEAISTHRLDSLIGSKVTKTTAEINVDNDGDGKADKTWVVKSDGSKVSEKTVTPIP